MSSFRVGLGASLIAGLVALPASAAQDPAAAGAAPPRRRRRRQPRRPAQRRHQHQADAGAPAPAEQHRRRRPRARLRAARWRWARMERRPGRRERGTRAAASGGAGMGGTVRSGSDKCQDRTDEKWIRRCRPERNMFELGSSAAFMFPASHTHELFNAQTPTSSATRATEQFWRPYRKVAPEIGLRVAWFPLSFLGGEVEGGVMPTKRRRDGGAGDRAMLFNFRAHVIGQLPFWRIAPFILVGGGGHRHHRRLGNDVDPMTHFGGGVKFYLTHRFILRLDIRDNVAARLRVDAGATNYPEILLGLSRRARPQEAAGAREGQRRRRLPRQERRLPLRAGHRARRLPRARPRRRRLHGQPGRVPGCPRHRARRLPREGPRRRRLPRQRRQVPGRPGRRARRLPDPRHRRRRHPRPSTSARRCPRPRTATRTRTAAPTRSRPSWPSSPARSRASTSTSTRTRSSRSRSRCSTARCRCSPGVQHHPHRDQRPHRQHRRSSTTATCRAAAPASVKRYLVEHGVEDARIETRGAGPDEPVDTNKTAAGRAKNRRIEFTILVQ
jgi:hypothetical protein